MQITDSIRATKLIIEKDISRDLVIYWYKAGQLHTDSYLRQQLKVVTDRIFGRENSVALIRLLMEIKGNNQDETLTKVKAFCGEIEPLLERFVP